MNSLKRIFVVLSVLGLFASCGSDDNYENDKKLEQISGARIQEFNNHKENLEDLGYEYYSEYDFNAASTMHYLKRNKQIRSVETYQKIYAKMDLVIASGQALLSDYTEDRFYWSGRSTVKAQVNVTLQMRDRVTKTMNRWKAGREVIGARTRNLKKTWASTIQTAAEYGIVLSIQDNSFSLDYEANPEFDTVLDNDGDFEVLKQYYLDQRTMIRTLTQTLANEFNQKVDSEIRDLLRSDKIDIDSPQIAQAVEIEKTIAALFDEADNYSEFAQSESERFDAERALRTSVSAAAE
jgi:hypothetical protein